jgi:hypothetical protein
MDDGRYSHYRAFYEGPDDGTPLGLVIGNCQAESVRLVLGSSPSFPYQLLRVPPVHELTPLDMAPLHRLLRRTEVLLTQPVRADYRGLPVGTAQLSAALPPSAVTLRWPVVRYGGLHPYTVIVRHPDDPSAVPPLAPYHDLRLLSELAGRRSPRPDTGPRPAAVAEVAARSVAELRRRERATADVAVADLLAPAGAQAARTPNHPGNPVLVGLARRLQAALGQPVDAVDPGRPLLNNIHAPLSTAVITALGLDAAARPSWVVDGEPVTEHRVRAAHRRWYRQHPRWVGAGVARHVDQMNVLGL